MIVPGSVSPLMWGQGDPLDEFGVIMNSVRFNPPDAPRFTRSLASTANTTKFTLFFSCKRSNFVTNRYFIFSDGSVQRFGVYFDTNDKFHVDANGSVYRMTSRVFRDPEAHLNCMIAIDTSLAPSNNCIRIYFDDKEEIYFDTLVNPSTGQAMSQWNNSSQIQYIGEDPNTGDYFGGMLSRVGQVAGQQLTPAATGSLHPKTGQWRPKKDIAIKTLVDAGGTNSFFLNFADGSIADATHLGKDFSAQGNNWTPVNISVAAGSGNDWMTDTPTNNFPTLNPLDKTAGAGTLTDGNLTFAYSSTGTVCRATMSAKIGKPFSEMRVSVISGAINFGLSKDNSDLSTNANGIYYRSDGQKVVNGVASAYGATYTTSDVIAAAPDMDGGTITFYKQTGGAGAFVSQGSIAFDFSAGYAFAIYNATGTTVNMNFGQQGFGYVAQHGALPAGFKAQCTKNLRLPAVPNASKAFAAVTDTGANILSTLSASESWSNYIRIVKRRDASEGWRWMFYDDPTNYLDSSGTGVKAAIPSFAGTSYAGYSLKASASNGVATGRLTHTNGVADTVTDGLGNTRKAIILKNEATGSWFVYHPDLTAGKLLYLEQTAGETTDATIISVTSNSFVAAAALPSGTYRWIALAEADGFLKLSKYSGNVSSDGPFVNLGLTPVLNIVKGISTTARSWQTIDTARDKVNPATTALHMESPVAENAGYLQDMVSNGYKYRTAPETAQNASESYIMISIAAFPFRYANAR